MKNRIYILTVYSKTSIPSCCCCNEPNQKVLTIDHINGITPNDKYRHGSSLYQWIKSNNYPDGFQVLCQNCNYGKRNNVSCVHKLSHTEINKRLKNNHYKYNKFPLLNKFKKGDIIECINCHERNVFFLAIDHINGNGRSHMKEFEHYQKYVLWLKKEADPKDFQILCHNCNFLKYIKSILA